MAIDQKTQQPAKSPYFDVLRQVAEGKITLERAAEVTGLSVKNVQARMSYYIGKGDLPKPNLKGVKREGLRCPECGATTTKNGMPFTPTWLARHRREEHGVAPKRYRTLARSAYIKEKFQTPNGHFRCPVCERTFDGLGPFWTHLTKSNHESGIEWPTGQELMTQAKQVVPQAKPTDAISNGRRGNRRSVPTYTMPIIPSPYGDGSFLIVGTNPTTGRSALFLGYEVLKIVLPKMK